LAIRLDKPWATIAEALPLIRGNLGVFQLGNEAGEVIYIGFAGGKSIYGLKGEVADLAAQIPEATHVRTEVNTAYQSRYRELLMVHSSDHGELPKCNLELNHHPARLGRMSPA